MKSGKSSTKCATSSASCRKTKSDGQDQEHDEDRVDDQDRRSSAEPETGHPLDRDVQEVRRSGRRRTGAASRGRGRPPPSTRSPTMTTATRGAYGGIRRRSGPAPSEPPAGRGASDGWSRADGRRPGRLGPDDGPAASGAAAGSGRTGSSIVAADYQSDRPVRPRSAPGERPRRGGACAREPVGAAPAVAPHVRPRAPVPRRGADAASTSALGGDAAGLRAAGPVACGGAAPGRARGPAPQRLSAEGELPSSG